MAGNFLKAAGLVCGGVLTVGLGAIGTHLSQPYLEKKFNPQRREQEEKLKDSVKDKEEQVESLAATIEDIKKTNETYQTRISSLTSEKDRLGEEINGKDELLSQKTNELLSKEADLQHQIKLSEEQNSTITGLTSQIETKKQKIDEETTNKQKIQSNLTNLKTKLALNREDILTDEALKLSSTYINVREIEWKSVDEHETATFKVVDYQNKAHQIKMKGNRPNHEQKAQEIKTQGINFGLGSDFDSWSKKVRITRYDIDYEKPVFSEHSQVVSTKNSKAQEITISDYFKPQHLKDAFRVLIAIKNLDSIFLCLDNTQSTGDEKSFAFCVGSSLSQQFAATNTPPWSEFSAKDQEKQKLLVTTNRFATINDFINYWTKKTVDFVKTGKVDLFDFLNPMLLSRNYQKKNL